MRSLAGQLAVLTSGAAASLCFRVLQAGVLARLLGLDEFGKYVTFVAIMAIVSRASDMGLPAAVAYHLRQEPRGFDTLYRLVWGNFVWTVLPATATAMAAAHLQSAVTADLHRTGYAIPLFVAFIAVNTPTWVFPAFLTASGDYSAHARLTTLDVASQAAAAIAACLWAGPSALNVIAFLTLEQAFMTALYAWLIRRYRRADRVRLPVRAVLWYGLRMQWGVLMKLLTGRLDIVLVGALRGPAMAALYAAASSIRDIGLLPLAAYAAPLQNMVIDRAATSGSDRRAVLASLMLQCALSLTLATLAVPLLPWVVEHLYGDAFRDGTGPAVILFVGVIFLGPAALTWLVFNAKGRPGTTSAIMTGAGVFGPLTTWGVLTLGRDLTAVAVGNLVLGCATLLWSLVALQRLQRYRFDEFSGALRLAWARMRDVVEAARQRITRGRRLDRNAPTP